MSSTFLHRVLRERGLIAMERLMGMLLVMVSIIGHRLSFTGIWSR
jgi:multiple antibiotic resistance protein